MRIVAEKELMDRTIGIISKCDKLTIETLNDELPSIFLMEDNNQVCSGNRLPSSVMACEAIRVALSWLARRLE
eukprot:4900310-Prymnesium_polylepis.3